jgi:hypothetical protein
VCPQCAGAMRIMAFIEQPVVIEKILTHLGLWTTQAHSPLAAGRPVPLSLQRVVAASPARHTAREVGRRAWRRRGDLGPPSLCLFALDNRGRCARYSPRPGGAVWRHA